MPKLHNKRQTN